MWLGKRYFILRRYWKWYFGNQIFASSFPEEELPHSIFSHQTPLLRKLKNLDMEFQYNKIVNLQIASRKVSGILIKPGETFSFWNLVGKTTKSKGYKPGMMLNNGKIVTGTGGGLCQMSNLIFWMVLHSPLTINERWRHSYDVFPDANRTQPFGSGATISYNYVDLQFKNETKHNFQLKIWLTDLDLHGALLTDHPSNIAYKIEEKGHQIVGESWGGYTRHNQIFRKKIDLKTDEVLSEELMIENHAILTYQPFLNK